MLHLLKERLVISSLLLIIRRLNESGTSISGFFEALSKRKMRSNLGKSLMESSGGGLPSGQHPRLIL